MAVRYKIGDPMLGRLHDDERLPSQTDGTVRRGDEASERAVGLAVGDARVLEAVAKTEKEIEAAIPDERWDAGNCRPTRATLTRVALWGQEMGLMPIGATLPIAPPKPVLRRRFEHLVRWWKQDTEYLSSISAMVHHPAYQGLIAMGPSVVPLLLKELEASSDHWFVALNAITGSDPIPVASRGKLEEMRRAWLEWGRTHGVRWRE